MIGALLCATLCQKSASVSRNNDRISGPESNSCSGCHNVPISGGAGDPSTGVFVAGQCFDFATFNAADTVLTGGTYQRPLRY